MDKGKLSKAGMAKDRFVVGDQVTWRDDYFAAEAGSREIYGDGPFRIVAVTEVDADEVEAVGHTQHIKINNNPQSSYSGLYFRKLLESELLFDISRLPADVYKDRFTVGDQVTWRSEHHATLLGGRIRLGAGPFTIVEVFNVPNTFPYMKGKTRWSYHRHTQEIIIDANLNRCSGAFFKKI